MAPPRTRALYILLPDDGDDDDNDEKKEKTDSFTRARRHVHTTNDDYRYPSFPASCAPYAACGPGDGERTPLPAIARPGPGEAVLAP